jgi:hypothetical protein
MGCPSRGRDEAENLYLSVFAEVERWSIEDGELVLASDDDELLRYAAAADE